MALPGPTTKTSRTARAKLRIIAARYGETGASPYLLPLSVDGLIIVASISLVEISGRLHTTRPPDQRPGPAAQPAPPPATPGASRSDTTERPAVSDTARAPGPAQPVVPPEARPPQSLSLAAAGPTLASVPPTEPGVHPAEVAVQPAELMRQRADPRTTIGDDDAAPSVQEPRSGKRPDGESAAQDGSPTPAVPAPEKAHGNADSPNVVPAAPREAIAYWQRLHPGIGIDDLAERVGKSPRQIRRYLRPPASNATTRMNGHRNDTQADTLRSPRP